MVAGEISSPALGTTLGLGRTARREKSTPGDLVVRASLVIVSSLDPWRPSRVSSMSPKTLRPLAELRGILGHAPRPNVP